MTRSHGGRLLAGLLLAAGLATGVAGASAATATPAAASAVHTATPNPTPQNGATTGTPTGIDRPAPPVAPKAPVVPGTVNVNVTGVGSKPSASISVIIGVTLLSVAPALLLMMTSFTKIIVVLGLTRNALGLQTTPPNQVLVGLALFLSLFIMGPVLSQVNHDGVQPYLKGDKTSTRAFGDGVKPLQKFMLDHTRKEELALFTKVSGQKAPASRDDVPLTTLIPSFMLSELKAAFIIGFVIFIPFLVIDIVVSSSLMSMGMMMLPPVTVSLPFKLLLFVLVDGWGMVITSLVQSYR